MKGKTAKVLAHLSSGKTITGQEALKLFGLYRLSSVIYNLREKGYVIDCEMIEKGDEVYGRYRLING